MMEKYIYDTHNNEKLTKVKVKKVWLNKDLLSDDSDFRKMFPDIWRCIHEEVDTESEGIHFKLKDLKKLILSSPELFIVTLSTELNSSTSGMRKIRQTAYITNGTSFIKVTWLLGFTNLAGCRFQNINPPYEDFVNEFVDEVYF